MAKVKFGNGVAEIRGSIAGNVYSRGSYGAYIRNKVTPRNPNTTAQQLSRTRLSEVSQTWASLSAAQRLQWNTQSPNFANTNIFGDSQSLTGFNLFGKLNKNILEVNGSVINVPPTLAAVTNLTSLSVVADTTAGTMSATFAPAIPATQSMVVWACAPQSAGKDFVKSEYRVIDILVTADTSPQDLAAAYITKFGALPQVGSKLFIKMKPTITLSGLVGTDLQATDIAV
tara:strand:+ start:2150 stop:2836 length:687 start_codon:yes stop_codon:yes gene_type:complete